MLLLNLQQINLIALLQLLISDKEINFQSLIAHNGVSLDAFKLNQVHRIFNCFSQFYRQVKCEIAYLVSFHDSKIKLAMRLFPKSTLYFSSLKVFAWSIVTLIVLVLIAIASPTTIIAPIDPVAPITVYVADFGYHARLILPTRQDGFLQYAYGDWDYFALNRHNWNNALTALFISTPGTLGRRKFKDLAELRQTFALDWQNILLSLEVSRNTHISHKNWF